MKLSSKTVRMSRSAEGRNAQKDMARRGRASTSRAALLAPDRVLTGRKFRRANRLTHDEAATVEILMRAGYGSVVQPTFNVTIGDLSRMISGWHLS